MKSIRVRRLCMVATIARMALIIGASLAIVAAARPKPNPGASERHYAVPEDGSVSSGAYENEYFGFRYPLPEGWVEDVQGPPPSATGYYSLVTLKPRDSLAVTLLIAAQDNFFATQRVAGAMDFVEDVKRQLDPALSAGAALQALIGGQPFVRLDYDGAGLHHAILVTQVRCHSVIFSVTSRNLKHLESVIASLNMITFLPRDSAAGKPPWPVCVQGYAAGANVLHRVDPSPTGPAFSSVPTRIIIAPNGAIKDVHPIGASSEQARSIEKALSQWRFKPYEINGKPTTVETGLLVKFSP